MKKNILDILENSPKHIKEAIVTNKFKKGVRIIDQECEVECLYILKKGTNKIYITSELGDNYLQIIIGPGEIYGELEVLSGKPSICTVEAFTDCEVFMISKDTYQEWLQLDNELSYFIIENISNKLYNKIKKSSKDVFYNLEYRFVSLMIELYSKNKSNVISISKSLIAEELATSIRSINRIIYKLVKSNIIIYKNRKIIILDLDKLQKEKERL